MHAGHSWEQKKMMIRKELRLLKNGAGYLKWRSNLKILIVRVVYLTEGEYHETVETVSGLEM
jgi:hypothetical protein